MGRGVPLAVALAGLLALTASAAAAELPDPMSLLRPAGAAGSPAPATPGLPDADPSGPAGAAAAAPRDVLAALAGALGAVGGGLASAAGALAGAGGAAVSALLAFLGALAAAAGAALGAAAGALGAALATVVAGAARLGARVAADPQPAAHVAVGTGALALQGLAHLRGFAPLASLYSRLQDHELLRHDARRRIYDFVQSMPGAHVSQVHQRVGLGWGTTVYHLGRLRDGQLLSARKVGNQLCHFVNGSALAPEEQQALAATKAPKAQAIVDFLKLRGPSAQHHIASELGMSSALVSWHAKRLAGLGVLERTRVGRSCVLTLRPPARAIVRPARPAASPMPAPPMAA